MNAFLARAPRSCCSHHAQEVRFQKRRQEDVIQSIEALADRMERRLRDAIYDLLALLADSIDLKKLEQALASGSIQAVSDLVDAVDLGRPAERTRDALHAAAVAGGVAASTQINLQLRGAYFAFDQLNPFLIQHLKDYELHLIKGVKGAAKEQIREALITGMTQGQNPLKVAASLKPGLEASTPAAPAQPPLPGLPEAPGAKAQAKAIKEALGLTPKQQKMIANFRKELESWHTRKSAKGWNLGGKPSQKNGHNTFEIDADGNPVDGITARRLRDYRYDATLQKLLGSGKPIPPEKIDKMVEAYHRRWLKYRAQTIARTEALRTTNLGVQNAWDQAIQSGKATASLVRRQWIVAKDERTCPTCAPIPKVNPKRGVPMGEPFKLKDGGTVSMPPLHPNCLPAGALVSSGCGIAGASMRWYEGDLAIIRTASGKELSATVNHPILTDAGWIGAGLLDVGRRVVCRLGTEALSVLGKQHENVPAPIEEVARAFLQSGEVAAGEMPVAPEHFHGDGAGSKVAVVGAHRDLRRDVHAALSQHGLQIPLQGTLEVPAELLAGKGATVEALDGIDGPSSGGMGGDHLGGTDFGAHASPLGRFGLGSPPERHPGIGQDAADGAAADAVLARQILDGSTGPVGLDEIVEVRRVPFAGHVFNLETVDGHYTANGLISHNCRCTLFIRQWEPAQLAQEKQP